MTFSSIDPATGATVWSGSAATSADVDAAVVRARAGFSAWSHVPVVERGAVLRAFVRVLETRRSELAAAISAEVGKPEWEAHTEVQSMIAKAEFSFQGYERRCGELRAGAGVTRFQPHGVLAVFGPFNFPGHLPNGHIMPALLAGNTIVFKPSEHAPLTAELTLKAWREAGLPAGALQVVQGGRETGAALAGHAGLNGLCFTGSSRTGRWLAAQYAKMPDKILALELGGNNPMIVWDVADVRAASVVVIQSAFLTAGQRCTCARRLIIPDDLRGDGLLEDLRAMIATIRIGPPSDRPEPFAGPVISENAALVVLNRQSALIGAGARPLVKARHLRLGTGLLSPGLLDVTGARERPDEEIFGPLLQVIRVPDFEAALTEANATRYGLAAGLLSDKRQLYERFRCDIRAGLVNWNQALTGASGAAPFGGVGRSGNLRPSGLFAADYCSYPVASIEQAVVRFPAAPIPGLAI